jgi:hypothetical protein
MARHGSPDLVNSGSGNHPLGWCAGASPGPRSQVRSPHDEEQPVRRNPLTQVVEAAGLTVIGLATLGLTAAAWLVASPIGTAVGSSLPPARR